MRLESGGCKTNPYSAAKPQTVHVNNADKTAGKNRLMNPDNWNRRGFDQSCSRRNRTKRKHLAAFGRKMHEQKKAETKNSVWSPFKSTSRSLTRTKKMTQTRIPSDHQRSRPKNEQGIPGRFPPGHRSSDQEQGDRHELRNF